MSDPTAFHWRRLAATVIRRAAMDAKGGNAALAVEARRWLAGDGCDLLDALDLDAGKVRRWLAELTPVAQLALW